MQQTILSEMPKAAFWDVPVNQLDVEADQQLIIPRALFYSTNETFEKDVSRLEKLYSHRQIIFALKATKERISNKVCALISARYQIEPFSRFPR